MVDEPTTEIATDSAGDTAVQDPAVVQDVAEDVLVEEVSIDGMCGVY